MNKPISTTCIIPFDDTIPQITEGAEVYLEKDMRAGKHRMQAEIKVDGDASCYIAAVFIKGDTSAKHANQGHYKSIKLDCELDVKAGGGFSIRVGMHEAGTAKIYPPSIKIQSINPAC